MKRSLTVFKSRLLSASWFVATLAIAIGMELGGANPVQAQTCQLSPEAIAEKSTLRQQALQGDANAQQRYQALLVEHARQLQTCRQQTWPQQQAIWLRLYPCDIRPGVLDVMFDQIVDKGYNQVYVTTFYDGQVLLPQTDNDTPWPSVVRTPGYENVDLLAGAIAKARERGLQVYAWVSTINFGYTYSLQPNRQQAIARNGYAETSLDIPPPVDNSGGNRGDADSVFIDPYHPQAQQDYYHMIQALLARQPDGILFDYIRHPRIPGDRSVASQIEDLWVYGSASQQVLLERSQNQRGRDLIQRFLTQGYITANDISTVIQQHPQEDEPMWQGRNPLASINTSPGNLQPLLQRELWYLGVAHATQGILDFLNLGTLASQRQGVNRIGTVFFPDGNQSVGQGFDSRLQPWDRFPSQLQRHPMAYATCGNVSCIVAEIQRVVELSPANTHIQPAITGQWNQASSNRPSIAMQMNAIQRAFPRINAVSHFSYGVQEPQFEQERKFCQL